MNPRPSCCSRTNPVTPCPSLRASEIARVAETGAQTTRAEFRDLRMQSRSASRGLWLRLDGVAAGPRNDRDVAAKRGVSDQLTERVLSVDCDRQLPR